MTTAKAIGGRRIYITVNGVRVKKDAATLAFLGITSAADGSDLFFTADHTARSAADKLENQDPRRVVKLEIADVVEVQSDDPGLMVNDGDRLTLVSDDPAVTFTGELVVHGASDNANVRLVKL